MSNTTDAVMAELAALKMENADYECEECSVQVNADDIPENESWGLAYGCLSMNFCKPCYERSWAEHPDNPANQDSQSDEDQYKEKCDNKCGCVLGIDVPIMIWMKGDEEMTLCSECYYAAGFWEDDENSDNEDEIREHKESAYQDSEDETDGDEEQD